MRIGVVGTGYVGLVAGACLAEAGNVVHCVDRDASKLDALAAGDVTIHEPGLAPLVRRNLAAGRLVFQADLAHALSAVHAVFITVGTPSRADGSSDLRQVWRAARDIGRTLEQPAVIVLRSTVPVGTTDRVDTMIRAELRKRGLCFRPEAVFNPEFLKEGDAVGDFCHPARLILGGKSRHAIALVRRLYAPFVRDGTPVLVMSACEAELAKQGANAMLAARISFMNEISALCEAVGADVERVREGIGTDPRIGMAFLKAGCGYGGSCLPKDTKALLHAARTAGSEPLLLAAIDARNERQKHVLAEKIRARYGPRFDGLRFALWGLAFKPGTDDMREAPSLALLESLLQGGARVAAFDPAAMAAARRTFPAAWLASGKLTLARDPYDAAAAADALILVTEWEAFRTPDLVRLSSVMREPVIFDGRNQYVPETMREAGFEYWSVGRAAVRAPHPAAKAPVAGQTPCAGTLPLAASVVVPTCRRPDLLARCLTALAGQRVDPARYEIVVVDDAPGHDARETVATHAAPAARRGLMIRYVPSPGPHGPAAARNLGWRHAGGAVIAFTDDDTVPERDWLANALRAFEQGADAACGTVIVPLGDAPSDYECDASGLTRAEFVTANCFCRRDVLERLGGFDERFPFPWREDSDLHFKLLRAEARLVRVPGAVVVHPVRPAGWGVSLKQQRKIMFDALLYKKYPDLYRARIRAAPRWDYYAAVAALLVIGLGIALHAPALALGAALAWSLFTAWFCVSRLKGTSKRALHVLEMLVTSALIPPIAVYWRLVGAVKFRTWFA